MAESQGLIPQKPDGNPLSRRDFLKDIGIAAATGLELYLTACRWRLQTPTPTPSAAPEPIKTSSPLPDATPTFQPNPDVNIDTSLPSPYSGFYFGQEKATPGTIFVGAIKGASFEANNRGYLIPQFDGVHESRLNYLYSQDSPDQTAGFLIDSSYLMQVFKATDSKGGVIGTLPDGTAVEYKNGLWEATVDGKTKYFNPLFANQKGKPFGYPVLADDNQGNLYTGICFDENGVLVTGTKMETAFKTASQIAWEAGYSGDLAKVASVSLNDWGNIVVYDSLGNQISVQPYLNSKAPAESFATATPTETLIPTPTESVSPEFWEALKVKQGGDWSGYLKWREQHKEWQFGYAVDGTAVHDVPIPGLEGVVADLAVRAYYYDAQGNKKTILVAMIIKLPDGSLVRTDSINRIESQAEIDQTMKDYPMTFQTGESGLINYAYIMTVESFIKMCGEECRAFPGVQAYQQFVEANQTALDEFLKTGSPALKIIFPARNSLGGVNILHENLQNQPPTP